MSFGQQEAAIAAQWRKDAEADKLDNYSIKDPPAPDPIDDTPIDATKDPAAAIARLRELSDQVLNTEGRTAKQIQEASYSLLNFIRDSFGDTSISEAFKQHYEAINAPLRETYDATQIDNNPYQSIEVLNMLEKLALAGRLNEETHCGDWQRKTSYQAGDLVAYNNNTYLCINDISAESPVAYTPPYFHSTHWKRMGKDNNAAFPRHLVYRGQWNQNDLYRYGHIVTYLGVEYFCQVRSLINTLTSYPTKSTTEWIPWDSISSSYAALEDYAAVQAQIQSATQVQKRSVAQGSQEAPGAPGWSSVARLSNGLMPPTDSTCIICGTPNVPLTSFTMPVYEHAATPSGEIEAACVVAPITPIHSCDNCLKRFADFVCSITHPHLLNHPLSHRRQT